MLKLALIQHASVHLNLSASLEKAEALIREATSSGANFLVFGECWLGGYPAWIDVAPNVANWNAEPLKQVYRQMIHHAIEVPGQTTKLLSYWAKTYKTAICMGANERIVKGRANGSLYNTFLIFTDQGKLAIHHRKLVPTFTERLLYAHGDGTGLKSTDIHGAQIGGLICWEHWMPHARQALHNEGEHVHLALWPTVNEAHQLASRHYAFEGRCFVAAVGQILSSAHVPRAISLPEEMGQESLLMRGGSCFIGPDGQFIQEPVFDTECIVYAEPNLDKVFEERLTLDVSGHYARPDIFSFAVNRDRKRA